MTWALDRAAGATLAVGLAAGCATIGDRGSFPEALPHGGTGQLRPLDEAEVGDRPGPAGAALDLGDAALGSAMVADGFLFYAAAERLEDPPMPPPEQPLDDVFLDAFGPRRILRAPPTSTAGFDERGDVVLTAEAPWEGGEVFDPWALTLADGAGLLLYAAPGGLGLAESDAGVDGPFRRLDGPVLAADDAPNGAPRRPSAIEAADGSILVYYESGGELFALRSDDRRTFVDPLLGPLRIEGEDELDAAEVGRTGPGAVALETRGGRRLVRLYFTSLRDDGTERLVAMGSEDGLAFERQPLPASPLEDLRDPAPLLLDDRVTLLYGHRARSVDGLQVRALIGAITPPDARLVEPAPAE
ncbi:MAG: hypothetical protein ACFCGT_22765 [Sandaracinaceae bacterium]